MSRSIQLSAEEIDFLSGGLKALYPSCPTTDSILRKLDRSTRRITIKSAKAKGRALQQLVCEQLSTLLHLPWGEDGSPIRSREMGQAGVDVILTGEAADRLPFAIECKSSEALSLPAAIAQARHNAETGSLRNRNWMLVHKRKEWTEPVVILPWNGFAWLLKQRDP